jgi:uncharacterized membrane protein YdbT with pleckstrin-like domain
MNPTDNYSESVKQEQDEALQKVHNPLSVMQPGERVICEIKRHPIGLFGIYLSSFLLLALLAVVIFIFGPQLFPNVDESQLYSAGGIAFLILLVLVLLFTYAASIVYNGNRWIVTTDSITQVTQTGLFAKQSSQLSMGNLEDITAEQNGILTQLFGYGLLKAETAGERSKFQFAFCPRPTYHAQCILGAREAFEQHNYRTQQDQSNSQPQPQQ